MVLDHFKEVATLSERGGFGFGNNFALIVVLFILLIIIGSAFIC